MWLELFVLVSFLPLREAAITAASVTPASLVAGVTGTVDVAFTTGADVPVGGTLAIIFPSTFYVASSTLTNVVGFDPTSGLAATPASSVATITIANTNALAGALSFTLDAISNPGIGTTSSYSIITTDAGGVMLETATVAGSTFAKGTITTAAVTATLLVAGASTSYTIAFTTDITLRIGSVITLQFPVLANSNIIFAGATLSALAGINIASTVVNIASPYIRLTVAGQDIAAGTSVSATYANIINPAAQTSGNFGVHTRHPSGAIFEENQAVAGVTYTAATLPSAMLTPTSYFAGIPTRYAVVFANSAYLPSGSRVEVTFPARFDISGATLVQLTNLPTISTLLSVYSATVLRLTIGNVPVAAGTGRTFAVDGIVNPGSSCDQFIVEYCSQTWETYTVRITDSGANLYEQLATVAGTPIVKKPLVYGKVRPLLKTQSTLTVATIKLNTTATIPLAGSIGVVFPAAYGVGTAPITVSNWVGIPVTSTSVSVAGNTISLAVTATIPPANGLSFTIDQITTPPNMATGFFSVRTQDASGNTIEENVLIGGEGCTYIKDCNGHGTCTLLSKVCVCNTGWGAPTDVANYKSPDCSTRVCPSDYSWNSIPIDAVTGHTTLQECSGMGTCDRSSGVCMCFGGFKGAACERMACPNDCSSRGTCMSMKEMAGANNALPIAPPTTYDSVQSTTSWDATRVFGCVCDSGWAVGTANGELQATEYFGADCSMRHCPTGNDPDSTVDETNCAGKTVPGGTAVGAAGNLCLVECSNRGLCSYKTGTCTCFQGYTGYACQTKDDLA